MRIAGSCDGTIPIGKHRMWQDGLVPSDIPLELGQGPIEPMNGHEQIM